MLNIKAQKELALQEKDLGIETNISIGQKDDKMIMNKCTKVIGDTKVIFFHNRL